MTEPLLQVRDLSITYPLRRGPLDILTGKPGRLEAVIGATFSLQSGQTLAIVGESGSGKSSLGRAILGLEAVAGGEVRFRGKPIGPSNRATLRREAAMVFQDPVSSLSPRRSVGQLIAEPFRIHGLTDRDLKAEVQRLLAMVGLPASMAERYPHQISGGQARRVGLARAVALDPKLVVADEPTAGLDVSVQAEVLNLMRRLQDQNSMAMVLITHNISLIRHVSDRIAVAYLGRIVEEGPVEALLSAPAHPYTAALIAAQPHPDPDRRRTAPPILGETPSLLARPTGCEFRSRCPMAMDICASQPPLSRGDGAGRVVRCHLTTDQEATT
ncbi:MAG TPA: ABC transporter ATP-binding protein [Tabrizicola sp.]|nr:ABC transporter ATP-binding protein [Tabrizicola sp.]